jgi:O-methyltransferase involved in polyketide biosynthesis
MEGLVPLLPPELTESLMAQAMRLSAPGTRLALEHVDEGFRTLPEQGALHGLSSAFHSHVQDPAAWLARYGWTANADNQGRSQCRRPAGLLGH